MRGGDQWDYADYWRGTKIDSLINKATQERMVPIGGTSAGMAIQGGFYFSAENGTVTSSQVLSNPYHSKAKVDTTSFLKNRFLLNVITDTHYDNPDRRGRHVGFLARLMVDYGFSAKGIACDEYTAVCIDTSGYAKVYGDHPSFDDNAYFIQSNCELPNQNPETCIPNTALTWDRNNLAIKVYKVKGTQNAANGFNLTDWKTGTGGVWKNWWVINGNLMRDNGNPILCGLTHITKPEIQEAGIFFYQNTRDKTLNIELKDVRIQELSVVSLQGKKVISKKEIQSKRASIEIGGLSPGVYIAKISTEKGILNERFQVQ